MFNCVQNLRSIKKIIILFNLNSLLSLFFFSFFYFTYFSRRKNVDQFLTSFVRCFYLGFIKSNEALTFAIRSIVYKMLNVEIEF